MKAKDRKPPPSTPPAQRTPRRAEEQRIDDPFAVFTEWAGEADTRAYANLSRKVR